MGCVCEAALQSDEFRLEQPVAMNTPYGGTAGRAGMRSYDAPISKTMQHPLARGESIPNSRCRFRLARSSICVDESKEKVVIKKLPVLALGTAALLTSGLAQAVDFGISWTTPPGHGTVTVTQGAPAGGTPTYYAGPVNITITSGPIPNVPGSFVSFCVDMIDTIGIPSSQIGFTLKSETLASDVLPSPPGQPVTLSKLATIGQLLAYAQSGAGFGATSAWTNVQGAAVQAAVWEVVFETGNVGYSLLGGSLRFGNNTALASVDGWWASIGSVSNYQAYGVLWHDTKQDFLVPVPEPEAYGMALAGMGVVAFAMRRRRADKQA